MTENHGTVITRLLSEEMRTSYIDYAMSVIVGRALPDARDGLKPVHRRVLYGMQELGLTNDKAYKKCARVVGDVLGKYHPHGDSSVYDTLVRMAQDFSLRYPLVDGQGNFGSIDGDNAAAMRYTESRLSKIANEMLDDIDKETVNFTDNFDASLKEPSVLPARLPNLLVNGSAGIAVGMATNMAPHQLGEIVGAIKEYVQNPDVTVNELMQHVPGPDFPTGGIIYGRKGIIDAYTEGRGAIKVRARTEVEETKEGRLRIIVNEIPYMVNKTNLITSIADLVKEKRIEGISDLRDESDRDGMRIVIELKRDAIPDVVLNNLFKQTQMENTFGILNVALVENQPKILNLKGLIEQYVKHREEVVTRRTQYLLRKAEERAHIVAGLIAAVDNLDEVIEIIRGSSDSQEARQRLVERQYMTVMLEGDEPRPMDEDQAKAILELRLSKLTGLEVTALTNEMADLRGKITRYREILGSRDEILAIVVQELDQVNEKYNDERRTQIVDDLGQIDVEDLIPEETVAVTITNTGYIKRIPLTEYRTQKRGGKGVTGMQTRDEEDFITDLFITSTHQYVLFFTNRGKVYWLKGYQLPEGSRQSKGKAIVNLLEGLEQGERIQAAFPVKAFTEDEYLFFATKQGKVKKTPLSAYARPRVTGIIAVGIEDGDELVGVGVTNGDHEIVLAKKHGKSIRFHESDVRPMGRPAAGVRGVNLENNDEVVSMAIIRDPDGHLATITENGYGKRTPISEYRLQGRGGNGIITIQTTTRNGAVVTVREVRQEEELLVMSQRGIIIRIPVSDVSVLGRNVQGNRIMRLADGDRVMSATVLAQEEEAEAAAEAEEGDGDGEHRVLTPDEPGGTPPAPTEAPADEATE